MIVIIFGSGSGAKIVGRLVDTVVVFGRSAGGGSSSGGCRKRRRFNRIRVNRSRIIGRDTSGRIVRGDSSC